MNLFPIYECNMSSVIANEELYTPTIIVLGVFGYQNKMLFTDVQEIMTGILQEIERLPDKILIPSEGNSSMYIQDWAESLHIKTQIFQSDWMRNGRSAQRFRDERIQKECTHALVFLSNRSDRLEKYAESLAKKGKIVFSKKSQDSDNQEPKQKHLVMLISEPVEPASTPVRKSSKGTKQTLLKFQKKE
jgi:hypothetical protein